MAENTSPQKLSRQTVLAVATIALSSFITRIIFLFHFSGYRSHIVSDMAGYWGRAHQRYDGDLFSIGQWTSHPVMTHALIAQIFKLLSLLNADRYQLEGVLILFNLLSAISIVFVYLIARDISKSKTISFAATIAYAFSYPLIYLNTFVLSENFAIPLLVFSFYGVLTGHQKTIRALLGGIFLGLALTFRPNLGISILPFGIYLILAQGLSKGSVKQGLVFGLGAGLILFCLLVENDYISRGALKAFSPNGGYTFFSQQCQPYNLTNSFYGGGGGFRAPSVGFHQEYGDFVATRPWHEQKYFFKLGLECMKENPSFWITNFKSLFILFWGPFFPAFGGVPGFRTFMPFFNGAAFFCVLTLGLFFFVPHEDKIKSRKMLLLLSVPVLNAAVFFLFDVDQRYIFPLLFAIYTAFFCFLPDLRRQKLRAFIYLLVLGMIFAGLRIWNWQGRQYLKRTFGTADIRTYPLSRLEKPRDRGTPWNTWGNLIMFPPERPVLIESKTGITASELEVSADCNDTYILSFYQDKTRLGDILVPRAVTPRCGLEVRKLSLPPSVRGKEFNRILVYARQHDKFCSIGHLVFR